MLRGRDHPRDGERRERFRLVLDILDLKSDHGELVGELFNGLVGVEMFLQPGKREFHDDRFPEDTACPLSPASGRGGALRRMDGTVLAPNAVHSLSRLRGRVRVGAVASTAVSTTFTNSILPPASGRRAA